MPVARHHDICAAIQAFMRSYAGLCVCVHFCGGMNFKKTAMHKAGHLFS